MSTKPRANTPGAEQLATTVFVFLGIVFVMLVIRTAWIGDDAYFTLRTVDNLINGYGPTWNVDERVQAYTHPLWMLALAALYALTREAFYTTLALSIFLSTIVFWLVARTAPTRNLATAGILCILLLSQAFIDYSTSGLENPATHLLLATFLMLFLAQDEPPSERAVLGMSLVAGLATLNRMDTILFYLPALTWLLARSPSWKTARAIGLGFAPFLAWELFSIAYYGFPFPNPAYAKLGTGISQRALIAQGIQYFLHSLRFDPITLTAVAAALALTAWRRSWPEVVIALGILLYLGYVLWIGGDFMTGRYFSGALLIAVVLLTRSLHQTGLADGILILALVFALGLAAPTRPWDVALNSADLHLEAGIQDERVFYLEGSSLAHSSRAGIQPHHGWAIKGLALRNSATRVSVGATGFLGYFAGPNVHIVDDFGLADPLLARLPSKEAPNWKIGHFLRRTPPGYVESLETGQNVIHSQNLAQFYDLIRLATRGPLWSPERLRAIWELNTGRASWLLADYRP